MARCVSNAGIGNHLVVASLHPLHPPPPPPYAAAGSVIARMNQAQGVPTAHILVNTLRSVFTTIVAVLWACAVAVNQSHNTVSATAGLPRHISSCNDFYFLGNAV